MRRRASTLGVMVALLTLAFASVASAGEVKGPPGPGGAQGGSTPIDGFWAGTGAASICSFSGLNDVIGPLGEEDEEGNPMEPTMTQSYGTFLSYIMKEFGLSAKEAKAELGESPADLCNPKRAPFGNPKK